MLNRIGGMRKRWFVIAASVAMLSIALVGGTALANGSPAKAIGSAFHHGSGHHDRAGKGNRADVLARVAEIIDIEQDTLEAAFKTAWDERAETRFDARIDELVADETLTQDEGDAAKTWFEDRPENSRLLAIRLSGTSDTDKVDSLLEKLVDAEKLTQVEADALSDWHDDRPDSLPESSRRHTRHERHDGDHSDKHADGDGDGDGDDNDGD